MDRAPPLRYEIIGVTPSARVVTSNRPKPTAPSESYLCAWGKERSCAFVMRYFPSRKGWRLLDIRNVVEGKVTGKSWSIWKGQVRGVKYWPTKDAAIMVAIQQLARHSSTR